MSIFNSPGVSLHTGGADIELQSYSGPLPGGSFITVPELLFGGKTVFDQNKGDILLAKGSSVSDNVADYLYYYTGANPNQQTWDISGACAEIIDIHNAVNNICTKPDGGENWAECDSSEGESNEGELSVSLDHFRIEHDGHALTCQPEEVTVRACQDAACTSLYTNPVTLTLSPSGWLGGNSQTINGGSGTFWLRDTTPESVTLGISASSIATANPYQCYEGGIGGDCTLEYHDTGFIFDVATLTACQDSSEVTLQAVRMDKTTQACVGEEGFAGTSRTLNFWSDYVLPATGSRALNLNGSALATAFPGTAVNVNFDATASAVITLNYRDAGQLALNARFVGSGG